MLKLTAECKYNVENVVNHLTHKLNHRNLNRNSVLISLQKKIEKEKK